jgi:hypothetical protein
MFRRRLTTAAREASKTQRHSEESDRRGYAGPASGWIAGPRNPSPAIFMGPTSLADTVSLVLIWKIPRGDIPCPRSHALLSGVDLGIRELVD